MRYRERRTAFSLFHYRRGSMPDHMMKIKSIVISALMLCVLMLAACSGKTQQEPEPAPAPAPGGGTEAVTDIPEGSILLFQNDEGAAKLIKDMEEGRVPVECRAMYDEMGSRPEVVMTDPEQITEAYNRLSGMIIGGKSDMGITDCYHYIFFKLQDGTSVGWRFEGTGLLCWGSDNYEVTQPGTIWRMVTDLQDGTKQGD